jgi:DNA-binding MarR family transcriptional regulator
MSEPEPTSTVLTLIRLAKVIEIVLAEEQLTVNQFRMLAFVEDGTPPLRELGVRLVMKPPNISTMLEGLVSRGLIRRRRHREDRRRFDLALTPDGRRVLATARTRTTTALEHLASSTASPERLFAGLHAWEAALEVAAVDLRAELNLGPPSRRRRLLSA